EREAGRELHRARRIAADAVARAPPEVGARRIRVKIHVVAIVHHVDDVDAQPHARLIAVPRDAGRAQRRIIADLRVIERVSLAKLAVFLGLGVAVGGVDAPGRCRRIGLGELEIGRIRAGLEAVGAEDDRAVARRGEVERRL
nr:hypothetical protein [Tanacetum cinerariifolium]